MLPTPQSNSATRMPYAASPDRKSTRLNSSHLVISYAVFCLKKKNSILVVIASTYYDGPNVPLGFTTAVSRTIACCVPGACRNAFSMGTAYPARHEIADHDCL